MTKIINVVTFLDSSLASLRMRQLKVAQCINDNPDIDIRMTVSNRHDIKADINLFHKHRNQEVMLAMVKDLREKAPESKIIFDITDYFLDDPKLANFYTTMASEVDAVITSSFGLAEAFSPFNSNVFMIPESFERSSIVPQGSGERDGYVWIGHKSNLKTIGPLIEEYGHELTVISSEMIEGVKRSIQWVEGIEETLSQYKTVLIPQPNKYKSENRVIEALAAGCEVMTFDSPCYEQISKEVRDNGVEAVLKNYTIEAISDGWLMIFEELIYDTPIKVKPERLENSLLVGKRYVRLNLGCGEKIYPTKEGWINVDLGPNPDVDLRVDVRHVNKHLGDNVADEIHAYHVIEHFFPKELPSILSGWYETLKPGGKICLELPDMIKMSKNILQLETTGNPDSWLELGLTGFYGDYSGDYGDPMNNFHKWAYTFKTLSKILESVGFVNCAEEKPVTHRWQRDFRIVAYKRK